MRDALELGRSALALSPRNAFFQKTAARRLWEEAWTLATTVQGAEDVYLASLRAQLGLLLGTEPEATQGRLDFLRRGWYSAALKAVVERRSGPGA